jgi:hypothetical protein
MQAHSNCNFLSLPLKASLEGWHTQWFYWENHEPSRPPFVATTVVASIRDRKLGEECWNSGLGGRLEAMVASIHLKVGAASIHLEAMVAAMSEAARLQETLPTTSRVVARVRTL